MAVGFLEGLHPDTRNAIDVVHSLDRAEQSHLAVYAAMLLTPTASPQSRGRDFSNFMGYADLTVDEALGLLHEHGAGDQAEIAAQHYEEHVVPEIARIHYFTELALSYMEVAA